MSQAARLCFKRPNSESGASLAITKILRNPLLEAATAFALGDVDKIVDYQFAITPGIDANNESMSESDAARIFGHNAGPSSRLGQAGMSRQRDAIDDKHSYPRIILNPNSACVIGITRAQRNAPGEDELFLRLGPLVSDGQQSFECFLIDDGHWKKQP